jgi:hypothetical protein
MNLSKNSFFPIGVWFEGKPAWASYPQTPKDARAYYCRCFSDLIRIGFNVAVVPNCPEELWEELLQSAQDVGLRIILEIGSLVSFINQPDPVEESAVRAEVMRVYNKIGRYPSLFRYQIRDEPEERMIPNWIRVNQVLREFEPARGGFSCFCSPEFIPSAARGFSMTEVVFDLYPHFIDVSRQSLGNFLSALDLFKQAAGTIPKWAVLQSFAKPEWWRYPTPEELRAVTYLSLAAGVKGLFYFIYQSMPDHPEQLRGLVESDGRPTEIYNEVMSLVREVRKISALVADLEPCIVSEKSGLDIRTCSFQEQGREVFIPNAIKGDVEAGTYRDSAGNRVLILAGRRPDRPIRVQISDGEGRGWKDVLTGEVFHPKNGSVTVSLAPGSGCVLINN